MLNIIVSPSLAFLDQAIPIIYHYRALRPAEPIRLFFPNPGTTRQLFTKWEAVQVVERVANSWHFPITQEIWACSESLDQVQRLTKWLRPVISSVNLFRERLPAPILSALNLALRGLLECFRVNVQTGLKHSASPTDWTILDVTELKKPYFDSLVQELSGSNILSVNHGLSPYEGSEEESLKTSRWLRNREDQKIIICANSVAEGSRYSECFGVTEDEVMVTGIMRHHPEWIASIAVDGPTPATGEERPAILLISRPAGTSYLPASRKRGYIEEIATFARGAGLKLLVKPHPKEAKEKVFEEVLGRDQIGISWDFTDTHVFRIRSKILFAVSFISGVCLDLLQLDIPTIERLDLRGLPEWDTEEAFRDNSGYPIIEYRKYHLVMGATTADEFLIRATQILENRSWETQKLLKNYRSHYLYPPVPPHSLSSLMAR